MDNEKNDRYYLERIKTDLKFVIDHTDGQTKKEIESNEKGLEAHTCRDVGRADDLAVCGADGGVARL